MAIKPSELGARKAGSFLGELVPPTPHPGLLQAR